MLPELPARPARPLCARAVAPQAASLWGIALWLFLKIFVQIIFETYLNFRPQLVKKSKKLMAGFDTSISKVERKICT